jgi:hypothetical protein
MAHYASLGKNAKVAEDEVALDMPGQTTVVVPVEFMPAIRQMLAQKTSN